MKCPTCTDTALVMTDRQGVEIDYCPQCRGVWLDRGELDKLIDRAGPTAVAAPAYAPTPARRPDFVDSDHGSHHSGHHSGHPSSGGYPAGRRKKSWLSDIFD
jgi:Zn-finger nucleic acid-binding protein